MNDVSWRRVVTKIALKYSTMNSMHGPTSGSDTYETLVNTQLWRGRDVRQALPHQVQRCGTAHRKKNFMAGSKTVKSDCHRGHSRRAANADRWAAHAASTTSVSSATVTAAMVSRWVFANARRCRGMSL